MASMRGELEAMRRQHAEELAKVQKALALSRAGSIKKDATIGQLEERVQQLEQQQSTLPGVVSLLEAVELPTGAAASAELTSVYPRVREVERRLCDAERLAKDDYLEILRDGITCCICLDRPKNLAFQCGHQTCSACATQLSDCPTCRVPITTRTTLFN